MADLNGDGMRDVISGSWPGEIFFFAGARDGAYEEPIKLESSSGGDVNVGQASAAAVTDWDRDGDLDLLLGTIEGDVFFVPNVHEGKGVPKFGDAQQLAAGGENIRVKGDAGPTVADWDGDGADDLICGDGQGGVWFYRATARGERQMPTLAAAIALVQPMSDEEMMAAYTNPTDDIEGKLIKRPGARTKVCIADWNGDSRLDVLVGDFQTTTAEQPNLSDEDIAERDRIRERQQTVMTRYQQLWAVLDAKLRERVGVGPEEEMTTEQQEKWGQLWDEVSAEVEGFNEVSTELQELWPQLARFEPERRNHGWVWVYLRKAADASASAEPGP
ncbi:MAG: VCBS repeat-containing protein [Phycisphaerales bacterium]|nr:VCBS repeat-containing protein [Phycisphaerales bacterium]